MLIGSNRAVESRPWVEKVHILLVEDNPGDVRLIQEALKTTELQYVLELASDGDEALMRLFSEETSLLAPDLIILDLNLSRKSGHEVLTSVPKELEESVAG